MTESASLEELKDFINAIRGVMGVDPINELRPGSPGVTDSCLITKNLNDNEVLFLVSPVSHGNQKKWCLIVNDDSVLADEIALALGLEKIPSSWYELPLSSPPYAWCKSPDGSLQLPDEIGQIVDDYDRWSSIINVKWNSTKGVTRLHYWIMPDDLEEYRKFIPYVDRDSNPVGDAILNPEGGILEIGMDSELGSCGCLIGTRVDCPTDISTVK